MCVCVCVDVSHSLSHSQEFGELLERYSSDVESYHTKSEIIKRDQVSTEVLELSEQLKAAASEAEYINAQEKMFGWACTKYGHVQKVRVRAHVCVCVCVCARRTTHSVPGGAPAAVLRVFQTSRLGKARG